MRQNFRGIIVSAFNPKTVKVRTTIQVKHPKVLKTIQRHKDYMAHDETNSLGIGDVVRIEACRPISATKKFAVAEVLSKSKFSKEALAARSQNATAQELPESTTAAQAGETKVDPSPASTN